MASERTYVSVILPLKLDWEPYYYVDSDEEGGVNVGTRVKVIFAGKTYRGVISGKGLSPETDISRIRRITGVEPASESISENEIRLWRFISEYYLCSIGEVYKAASPSGLQNEEEASRRIQEKRMASALKKANYLREQAGRLEERLHKKEEKLAKLNLNSGKARNPDRRKELAAKLGEEILSVTALLEEKRKELKMMEDGDVSAESDSIKRPPGQLPSLSDAQKKAVGEIHEAFKKGKTVLLDGVTGSGKTEVFITLASETLSKGKNVLYLVPEIAMGRQLEERLRKAFGDTLRTFHSGETLQHRHDVRSFVRESSYIVLGTRSSIFLPHHDLGLVIIDEEHDSSYKQDSPSPRYNGRDSAIFLGSINGSDVILGTATPSLESLYNVGTGKWARVALDERFHDAEEPEVEIIDTIAERKKNGMVGSFSRKLIDRINRTLRDGGQSVILRARRSYSPMVQCVDCGHIPHCPHCNVALTYHKDTGRLVCHHCGWSAVFDPKCPECGGDMRPSGAGTQKVEEEVKSLFPEASVERLDSDTAKKRGETQRIIKEFSTGACDILIGTQIISKGFDFEGLTLVAALQADTLSSQEDFRSDEKCLQTLRQLKGRCGRRDKQGRLVIQTSRPDHPVYKMLLGELSETELLSERKAFSYPPYYRLINIQLTDSSLPRLEKMSSELEKAIRESFSLPSTIIPSYGADVIAVGPYAPVIDKLSDKYIRIIRIHIKRGKELAARKKSLKGTIREFEESRLWKGHVAIDVDPV